MNKTILSLSFILLLSGISPAQAAEELQPQHLQRIEALQRRADILAAGPLGASNYHLAKARTWLDFALSEYHDKEISGIVTDATEQAEALLDALEKKQTDIPLDTPRQLKNGEEVRPDLWNKIAALKSHAKFTCGQRQIAEAEVQLVWTGHEKAEYGWSHAESYARTAEDRIYEAQVEINNCAAANYVSPNAQPCNIEKITLSGDAMFEFGKATLNPASLWRLDKLANSIKILNTLEEVILIGHTDHLRRDGHQERNQLLSEQRAESVKQYLVGKGIAAERIHASGAGSSQPIVNCSRKQSRAKQAVCAQPNRRVEIILRGSR